MKKIIPFLSILLFTTTVYAQSFKVLNDKKEDVSNGAFTVTGAINTTIKAQIYIVNSTGDTLSYKVKKEEINVLSGTTNTFCFNNQCYPPFVFESPTALNILPGDTSKPADLYGEYSPNDVVGTSVIRYTIFNANDTTDYTTVEVTYNAETTSYHEPIYTKAELSNPFPNPATNYTKFNYHFPFEFNNARLELRNIIGSVVKEVAINDRQGTFVLELDDVNDGVYFYTLIIDSRVILTRKLIKK